MKQRAFLIIGILMSILGLTVAVDTAFADGCCCCCCGPPQPCNPGCGSQASNAMKACATGAAYPLCGDRTPKRNVIRMQTLSAIKCKTFLRAVSIFRPAVPRVRSATSRTPIACGRPIAPGTLQRMAAKEDAQPSRAMPLGRPRLSRRRHLARNRESRRPC